MKRLFLFLFILPMLAGCLTQANRGDDATEIVKQVHQAFKDHNWDAIMPLYDKKFFDNRSKEQWLKELKQITADLGPLKSVQPTFQQKDPRFGGDFYLFGSLLKFEHASISETLTVYQGIDAEHMVISGHLLKLRRHKAQP
ncbi:MAG: hypothetical protein R8L58_00880 [Mariprofundaceae bacterium]